MLGRSRRREDPRRAALDETSELPRPAGPAARAVPTSPLSWDRIVIESAGHKFEPRPSHTPGVPGPDTECDGWSTAALTLRWAAVRGDWHRYYHQPRQDQARAAVHRPSGATAFAVADGVSSAESAEVGALDACCAALTEVLHQLDRGRWPIDAHDVAAAGSAALHHRAAQWLGVADPPTDRVTKLLATTLVAGAVRPGPGGVTASLMRIGDSGAWILDRGTGEYRSLFRAKTDDVVLSNSVSSLPHIPSQLDHVTFPLEPRLIMLVGTDGFGDPLGDGTGPVGTLFAGQLASSPPPPLAFAHLLDFSRETYDDDRALLAVWSHAESS